MADIMFRTRFVWSGWSGGPGYTTLYGNGNVTANAQTFATEAYLFMSAIKTVSTAGDAIASTIRIDQDPFLTLVESTNGKEQGVQSITPGAQIAGTSTAAYAAPAGACVNWITGNWINGRRLRGKSYLVPLTLTAFQTDGTLSPSYLTAVRNAASSYHSGTVAKLVWHRPTSKGAVDGMSSTILSALVNDRVAVMRSRRA